MLKRLIATFMVVAIIASHISVGSFMNVSAENNDGMQQETTGPDIRTIYVTTDGTPITKEKKVAADIVVMDKAGGDAYEEESYMTQ